MAQNSGKKSGKPTPHQQDEEEETLQEQINRLSADLTGHKGAAHKLSSTLASYGERLKLLEDSRADAVDPAIRTLRGDVAEFRAFTHGSSSRHDEQERQLADVETAIKELQDKGHPVPGALAHLLEGLTDTLGAIRQAAPQLRAPPPPTIDLALATDQQEQQEKAREELRQLSEHQRLTNQRKRELERSLGQNSEEPPRFNRNAPKGPGAFTTGDGPSRHDRRAEDDPVAKFNRLDRTAQRDLVNSFLRGKGN